MADLTIEQANDILSNKENPSHAKFWANDKATVERVNGAFEVAHPGNMGDSLGLHVDKSFAEWDKERQQGGGNQSQQFAGALSEEWDFSREQAEDALRPVWGDRHAEHMAALESPENFGLLFGGFLKTPEDRRYLEELFQTMGNHPAGYRLYVHLLDLVKRAG
jgi:hypothetical protein